MFIYNIIHIIKFVNHNIQFNQNKKALTQINE